MEPKFRTSGLLASAFLLLLIFSLSSARRLIPRIPSSSIEPRLQGFDGVVEESCEGVSDEECLERRILLAHTDYIYTQKENP